MIFSTIFNIFLLFVLSGYSFALKMYISPKNTKIKNLDLLYGLFLLIILSLFLNFFFPLKYFFYPISIIGFSFFIFALIKKQIKINFLIHLLIIFSFIFIIYSQGDNVDSPMYHLQIIKWISNEKIVFGLSNLEIRFGSNSLWFALFSLLKFHFHNFNSIYIFNLIPFSILIYQVYEKKNDLSYYFVCLSIIFILFFSFLHPFLNGVILNHLHNTELDTVAMVFFILSFYLFLKYFENKNEKTLKLLFLSSAICFFIKLSYFGVVIFPMLIIFLFYKKKFLLLIKDKLNIILILSLLMWLVKNLIISGCFVFPVSFTCLSLGWSPGAEEIKYYSNVVKGFARDTRERAMYLDFNHTIYTFKWFIPWFKDYALNAAFLIISFFISISSIIFLFITSKSNLLKKNFLNNLKIYLIILACFLPSFFIWFQAPEIRFGWGLFISFSCYLLSLLIFNLNFLQFYFRNFFSYMVIIIFGLLIFDNKQNLNFYKFLTPYSKQINYSQISKVKTINGYEIYKSNNWQCYDFDKICVNTVKDYYDISKKFNYLIIKVPYIK